MQYGLKRMVLGDMPFVEISADEFLGLLKAKDASVMALGIEEKFGLLLSNYAEFEGKLQELALDYALFGSYDWDEGVNRLFEVNRLLSNFLSACRLYLDQVPHSLNTLFGDPNDHTTAFRQATHDEYDGVLGYRVLESLRNYAQHRDFPLHSVKQQAAASDREGMERRLRHSFTATISLDRLEKEGGFKATILDELRQLGDEFDIKPLARAYLSALGRVHAGLHADLRSELDGFAKLVRSAIDRYARETGDDQPGLSAVERDDSGHNAQVVYLSMGLFERQRALAQRHGSAQHFERMSVADEPGS